ncbi:MAG: Rossmann-like and DUF2520 domain-containing protein [Candidatus Hodarchaeota archaeon]
MNLDNRPSILIIGGGRTGASFATHLVNKHVRILSLVEKDQLRARFLREKFNWQFLHYELSPDHLKNADIIILSVNDDSIAGLTKKLAEIQQIWKNKVVIHCSGALPSKILEPLQKKEASIASLHPIYSFSDEPLEYLSFDHIWFTIEGDPRLSEILARMLDLKQDQIIKVNQREKLAIHIACVFYANFYIALADIGLEILNNFPAFRSHGLSPFKPLILSTIENITKQGIENALTGPVRRGDVDTLLHHLKYLDENHPKLKKTYQLLGKRLVKVTKLPLKEKDKIRKILDFE